MGIVIAEKKVLCNSARAKCGREKSWEYLSGVDGESSFGLEIARRSASFVRSFAPGHKAKRTRQTGQQEERPQARAQVPIMIPGVGQAGSGSRGERK
jgi:hypothetical protein